jgi:hypothetical protein
MFVRPVAVLYRNCYSSAAVRLAIIPDNASSILQMAQSALPLDYARAKAYRISPSARHFSVFQWELPSEVIRLSTQPQTAEAERTWAQQITLSENFSLIASL